MLLLSLCPFQYDLCFFPTKLYIFSLQISRDAFDSCFGVAVSPGNLVIATVCCFSFPFIFCNCISILDIFVFFKCIKMMWFLNAQIVCIRMALMSRKLKKVIDTRTLKK